jgi:hypothetical protein
MDWGSFFVGFLSALFLLNVLYLVVRISRGNNG